VQIITSGYRKGALKRARFRTLAIFAAEPCLKLDKSIEHAYTHHFVISRSYWLLVVLARLTVQDEVGEQQ
jgi:hypothetical protein